MYCVQVVSFRFFRGGSGNETSVQGGGTPIDAVVTAKTVVKTF